MMPEFSVSYDIDILGWITLLVDLVSETIDSFRGLYKNLSVHGLHD